MKVLDIMLKHGNWLFRYRSYLPICLLIFAIISMWYERPLYLDTNIWFTLSCLVVAAGGEIIRILAVGYAADRTSGRNVKRQVADEINQTGIYSILRHPLYLGNFIIWLSVALFTEIWWILAIYLLFYIIYYERIVMAEESFLEEKFGDEFRQYAQKIPAVILSFKNYIPNKNTFRIKKVLRQENSTVYGIIMVFTLMKIIKDLLNLRQIKIETYWIIVLVISSILYLVLRTLKKLTRVLHED